MLGLISVRKKKHSEQMMKVHMVTIIQLAIVLNVMMWERKTILGEKAQKNHDTNYNIKPVMFQVSLVLERSKF